MKKLFIIFAVLCLAAPAMAADWEFYGSARMWTGMKDVDKEANGGVFDDTDLEWQDLGNSRFGGRVQISDQISGGFELGFDTSTGVYERKIFGIYDFGGAKLLVGQDYTPLSIFYSGRGSDADEGFNNYGGAYDGRQEQLKIMVGGLNIAFVKPKISTTDTITDYTTSPVTESTAVTGVAGTDVDDTDTTLPKIVIGYTFSTDMIEIRPMVGYQSFDFVIQNATAVTETEESVDAWVGALGAKFNFGPAYVNLSGYYAQNPKAFGLSQRAFGDAIWNSTNNTLEDNTSYAGMLIVGFNINDMFGIEAGYGMSTGSTDLTGGGSKEQTASAYYVNFPIHLADGFFFVPEVCFEDYGDLEVNGVDTDKGKTAWYGIRWQVDF